MSQDTRMREWKQSDGLLPPTKARGKKQSPEGDDSASSSALQPGHRGDQMKLEAGNLKVLISILCRLCVFNDVRKGYDTLSTCRETCNDKGRPELATLLDESQLAALPLDPIVEEVLHAVQWKQWLSAWDHARAPRGNPEQAVSAGGNDDGPSRTVSERQPPSMASLEMYRDYPPPLPPLPPKDALTGLTNSATSRTRARLASSANETRGEAMSTFASQQNSFNRTPPLDTLQSGEYEQGQSTGLRAKWLKWKKSDPGLSIRWKAERRSRE